MSSEPGALTPQGAWAPAVGNQRARPGGRETRDRDPREVAAAARAETRPECHGARFLRPSHLPLATAARPRAVPRPRGMDPHVLGAGLYWLLLPCTLLAGEWRARAGRLRPRTPVAPGPARVRAGEHRRGDSAGLAAQGARIPEA